MSPRWGLGFLCARIYYLMDNPIVYRHWQPGDDAAVLVFRPNTNKDWFRHKFDDENLEPEGIRLAFHILVNL